MRKGMTVIGILVALGVLLKVFGTATPPRPATSATGYGPATPAAPPNEDPRIGGQAELKHFQVTCKTETHYKHAAELLEAKDYEAAEKYIVENTPDCYMLQQWLSVQTMKFHAAEDRESAAYILPYCKSNLTMKEVMSNAYIARKYESCADFVRQMRTKRGQVQMTPPVTCIFLPHDASNQELVDGLIRYAGTHPEELDQPFIVFARDALADEWPCK